MGILIDFKLNQDFIAKALCINKEKPMSNCNGKCILAQKLKKAGEPQKKVFPLNMGKLKAFIFCNRPQSTLQGIKIPLNAKGKAPKLQAKLAIIQAMTP